MRLFKLQFDTSVASLQEYDLMSPSHFLTSPDGFGTDFTFETFRSGSIYVETNSYQNQKTISGQINFASYTEYKSFMTYIGENELFRFMYSINDGSTWYACDCKLGSIKKGELEGNRLICDVTFICFSSWYREVTMGVNTYAVTIPSSSPSPIRIETAVGALTSLTWSLYHQESGSDVLISSGSWTGSITSSQKLVIDSRPNHMQIAVYDSDDNFVRSEYSNCDFTTERFLYVPADIQSVGVSDRYYKIVLVTGSTSVSGSAKEYGYEFSI